MLAAESIPRRRVRPRSYMYAASISIGVLAALAALAADPGTAAASRPRVLVLLLGLSAACARMAWAWRARPAHSQRARVPHAIAWSPAGFAWLGIAWMTLGLAWGNCAGVAECAVPLGCALLGYALSALGRRSAQRTLLAAGVTVALAQGVRACVQWQAGQPIVGFSGNPDWLGLTLAPALALQVAAAYRARAQLWGRALAALLPLPLIAFALAQSRVAWIAAAVGAVIFALVSAPHGARPINAAQGAFAPSVAAAGFHDAIAAASVADRLWIWQHGLRACADSPIWGVGTGRFHSAFLVAQGESLALLGPAQAARRFANATTGHSQLIHALVENGSIGGLLLACLLASWMHRAHAHSRFACALVATMVLCMLGDMAFAAPPFAVLAACSMVAYAGAKPVRHVSRAAALRPANRASRAMLTVGIAAVAVWVLLAARDAYLGERARVRANIGAPELRAARLRSALLHHPHEAVAALELAGLHAQSGWPVSSEMWLSLVDSEFATPATWVAHGTAALAREDRGRAVLAFRNAIRLNPGSLRAQVNLAEVCRLRGDLSCATQAARAAAAIAPSHPKVLALLERLDADAFERAISGTSAAQAAEEWPE